MEIKLVAGDAANAVKHVLFVHGLTGHPKKTWTSKGEDGRVFWPVWLAQDLRDCAIWSIGYPAPFTNWFRYAPKLSELCDHILAHLKSDQRLEHGAVYFVAHSLGGLVVKQTLLSAKRDAAADPSAASLLKRTKGVAFLGTPHRGAPLANLAMLLRRPFRISNAIKPLAVGDDQIQSVFYNYRALAQQERIRHLPLCEGRPGRFLGITLPFRVVDLWSADPGVNEAPVPLIDQDHSSIAKPRSRDASVYRFLIDFVGRADTVSLPQGFERPEWLAGEKGLRARLNSSVQAYVPAPDGPTVDRLLAKLEDHTRPLVITGDGGFGKTRLALEIYLASGREGILIQKSATPSGVEAIIQQAKERNRKVLFLIDYIEELGNSYDAIHQTITRRSDGFASLVTTTRTLAHELSSITGRTGPEYLSARHCEVIALNQSDLAGWRKNTCAEILDAAQMPVAMKQAFEHLDVPVIATLVAYDFVRHGATDDENVRADDSGWLTRRLRRRVDPDLSGEDFALLLSLYPFGTEIRNALNEPMRKAADTLLRKRRLKALLTPTGA